MRNVRQRWPARTEPTDRVIISWVTSLWVHALLLIALRLLATSATPEDAPTPPVELVLLEPEAQPEPEAPEPSTDEGTGAIMEAMVELLEAAAAEDDDEALAHWLDALPVPELDKLDELLGEPEPLDAMSPVVLEVLAEQLDQPLANDPATMDQDQLTETRSHLTQSLHAAVAQRQQQQQRAALADERAEQDLIEDAMAEADETLAARKTEEDRDAAVPEERDQPLPPPSPSPSPNPSPSPLNCSRSCSSTITSRITPSPIPWCRATSTTRPTPGLVRR